MNPLPRFVALALFLVLAALVTLLALPVWRGAGTAATPTDAGVAAAGRASSIAPAAPTSSAAGAPARAAVLARRAALTLAVLALLLAVALIVVLALRAPMRSGDTQRPFVTRTEVGALARLAESSVAQEEELSRERDVRRRAEEDARLKQTLLTQSLEEKIRIGRDLHDGIIQSLYAAGLTVESVRALVRSRPDDAEKLLEQTRTRLNDAIRDVRAYIVGLAPDKLRRAGFAHAVNALIGELGAGRDIQFDINIDDAAAALLSADQNVEALQIAHEAVSNALRHGQPSRITLRMHKGDRELCLLVQDNGVGFNATHGGRDGGHGLGNMHARAQRLGATLKITSHPGEGTRVLATLPILEPTTV